MWHQRGTALQRRFGAALAAHRSEAGDLVAQPLRLDDCDLLAHPLVGVEVGGQAAIVLLNDDTARLLDGLRANAPLLTAAAYLTKDPDERLTAQPGTAAAIMQALASPSPHASRRSSSCSPWWRALYRHCCWVLRPKGRDGSPFAIHGKRAVILIYLVHFCGRGYRNDRVRGPLLQEALNRLASYSDACIHLIVFLFSGQVRM